MFLTLLLFLNQMIPIDIQINIPIEICQPVLLIDPPKPEFKFYTNIFNQLIILQSTCKRIGIKWEFECDNYINITVLPGSGVAYGYAFYVYIKSTEWESYPGTHQITCQLRWEPCSQGDMTYDCIVDKKDIKELSESLGWNRLEVMYFLQRDYR